MPSLYVHVPFCQSKCGYCAFFSVPLTENFEAEDLIAVYLNGLEQEMKRRMNEVSSEFFSLYLGGGTPSVLNPRDLARVLELIHKYYNFTQEGSSYGYAEKTCEINPGTINREKMAILNFYGLNRISLGAQCFNDRILKAIGRIHKAEDIVKAVKIIRKAKIENLNLDLMFGLPGQTMQDWQNTLLQAVSLEPEHLALYALTLEKNTPFARRYLNCIDSDLPDDDLQADMYEWAVDFLDSEGYNRYEISNFAKPGFECRHNLAYWQKEDYIGLGPAAVSCLNNVRIRNERDIGSYSKRLLAEGRGYKFEEAEVLTLKEQIAEYIFLGLRTVKGVDINSFKQRFNIDIQDIYGYILKDYQKKGLIIFENGKIKINPSYFLVANSILEKFV